MNADLTKTPYNSIYEALDGKNKAADLVCCSHGTQCQYGVKPEKNQYVNLPQPKKSGVEEKELCAKLNQLVIDEMPRGKEEAKKAPEMMSLNSLVEAGFAKKPKKRRNEEKKREVNVVDDNQSYVMLGDSSDDGTKLETLTPVQEAPPISSEISTFHSEISSKRTPAKPSEANAAYLGVTTTSGAEASVQRRGEFALYHLFQRGCRLDTLAESLPLMLVYRTTTRASRHYTIRTTFDQQFFVDCGYPKVRRHVSLNQLVHYYKASAALELNPDDTSADSFSWWLE